MWSKMYYSKLYKKISSYIDLDEQDIDLIKSSFRYQSVTKGTPLIDTGKYSDKAFFILSGYLKYYKTIDSGEELIIHLYAPNNFATSLNSFFLATKSEEVLETITNCELLFISRTDLDKLYVAGHKWQEFGRKLMESFLIEKEERIIDLISLDAHAKYSKLCRTQPDIIQNVPAKHIASYIGIKPESLSRIRKMN